MPRRSSITPELLAEVQQRRAAGEEWKVIAADLRRRGLPAGRTRWHYALRGVHERRGAGIHAADAPPPVACPAA